MSGIRALTPKTHILLNGEPMGWIKQGSELTSTVDAGTHVIQIAKQSPHWEVDLGEHDSAEFLLHPGTMEQQNMRPFDRWEVKVRGTKHRKVANYPSIAARKRRFRQVLAIGIAVILLAMASVFVFRIDDGLAAAARASLLDVPTSFIVIVAAFGAISGWHGIRCDERDRAKSHPRHQRSRHGEQ